MPDRGVERPRDRSFRRGEGRAHPHSAEHGQSDRFRIAIPRLDTFLERREDRRVRQDLRPPARADPDRAFGRRATNRLPDRLEGVRQIEGVDPDGAELRFEGLEPTEAGGPERVSSRHQDEPVVRHEPQRREDVPLVEAHRGDEGAEGHGLTRRGGPCRAPVSR